MRFVFGEIPKNPHYSVQDYERLKEPEKSSFMAIAGILQIVLWTILFFCWRALIPELSTYFTQTSLLGYLMILLIIFPLHEIFHAMVYPLKEHRLIVFGIWPKMGVCYAMYEGKLTRNRWLLVYGMPFMLITLAPIIINLHFTLPSWLIIASILNAGFAAGDIAAIAMICHQVPRHAVILQNGWDTYWKSTVNKSMQPIAKAPSD